MQCKNCGTEVTDVYCPKCGQHSRVERINFSSFIQEISETLLQVDRGFFKTLIELFWRPGYAIKDYLRGKRKDYYKPLAYALTLSTIYFVLTRFLKLETFFGEFFSGYNAGYEEGFKGEVKLDENLILDNYALVTLLLIPLYAFTMLIAFVDKGLNFLEHIAIRSFVVGQQAIIYLFFSILIYFLGESDTLEIMAAFIPIIYVFWVNIQLFSPNNTWNTIIRTIGFYIMLLISVFVLMGLATSVMLIFNQVELN